jgi:hypothetical protein
MLEREEGERREGKVRRSEESEEGLKDKGGEGEKDEVLGCGRRRMMMRWMGWKGIVRCWEKGEINKEERVPGFEVDFPSPPGAFISSAGLLGS